MTRVDNLPRHGRSRDILQHQSSFHTHTGTWHICTGCPSTPDETARNMRALTSRTKKKKKSESMSDQVNQHLATFIYLCSYGTYGNLSYILAFQNEGVIITS